jgi:hypothetical protein
MRIALTTTAALLLAAALCACGSEPEAAAPEREKSSPRAEPPAAKADAGPALMSPSSGAGADHKPIGPEDREVLARVYLSFAEDPEGFVRAVEELTPERRERIAGYLMCAAGRIRAAGQPAKAGAPAEIQLPIEAQELIRFEGSPERARSMFLKQLAGEFLIVGRSIQSIHEGDKAMVEQVLARQRQNLELMKVSQGPERAAEWSATIRRVFPILFARLLPEC